MTKKNVKKILADRPRSQEPSVKHDREVEESLRAIYATEEGLPDLTRLEKKKSYRWIVAAIGIPLFIMALCAAAWSGFWYFKSFQRFGGKGLELSIEGPNQISLGQETTYFVNYQNVMREPLTSVEVHVNFPADFVPTEITPPTPDKKMVWKLGALAAEEQGTLTVKGRFTGALGTQSTLQAIATYRPASYSSDFEALITRQVTYAETVMEGWLQVPEKAVPGDHIALIYHLKNKGLDPQEKMETRIILPEGFTMDSATSSRGQTEGRTYKQSLPTLQSGSTTEIVITGVFASGFGGQAKVTAQAGTLSPEGTLLASQLAEASFPVLAGDLSLKLVVNGSDGPSRSVGYGDSLQCSLGFENTADEPLKKVTIRLALETFDVGSSKGMPKINLVDWEKIRQTSSTTRKDQMLIWDPARYDELKEIPQKGNGSLELSIPLVTQATGTGLLALRATVFADIEEIGDTKIKRTIQIAPFIFRMRSDAGLSAEARYYSEEGAPLGSGPLPPKVGENTRYRVFWSIDKRVHGLKDLSVSAVLPRNVSFVAQSTSTAGEMSYDANSRLVTWKLNRLPVSVSQAQVEFEVQLTPLASDDGRFVDLVGDATFQAYDEDIKENIIQVAKSLDTDLQNDESAKGKGVVRK